MTCHAPPSPSPRKATKPPPSHQWKRKFPAYHSPPDRSPVVLAIRVGDWCGLVNGLGEIVAQMSKRPDYEVQGKWHRGLHA